MEIHQVALPAGAMVGNFRIDRELGRGGFGITYRATDSVSNGAFALKEYFPLGVSIRDQQTMSVRTKSPDHEQAYEEGRRRVETEARTLVQFRHRNIVQLHGFFPMNNTVYLVLAYEHGNSLKNWLKMLGRPPTQQEFDALLDPILDALETVHRNGLLHRDLAPDNIYIRETGQPVLLDFGSARAVMAGDGRTAAVTGFVKVGYSPAEQAVNDVSRQGPWTDIYALGATLYEAISRQTPPDALVRRERDSLVPLRSIAGGAYRPGFIAAVDHAMMLPVDARPRSIGIWRMELFGTGPVVQQAASVQTPQRHQPMPIDYYHPATPDEPSYGQGMGQSQSEKPSTGLWSRVARWLR